MFKNHLTTEQFISALLSLLFGIIGAMMVHFITTKNHPQSIATVNITGLVGSYVKETTQQPISMQEKQERIKRFGLMLNKATDQVAQEKQLILVPSEAVLAGSKDVTQEVQTLIQRGLSQ